MAVADLAQNPELGRPFGHFIFSLIGLNRILFTNTIFQRLYRANLVNLALNSVCV